MDDTSGGFSGWLTNLLNGGGNQPTSLAAPGQDAPTPDSAGLPVDGSSGGPSMTGAIGALGQAAPAIQKAMQGQQQGGGQPSMLPPRPMPNPYATALASVMAGLNAKNKIGQPQQQAAPAPQNSLPGGTQ